MIEQLPGFSGNVVALVCKGQVTKADYDAVLVPAVRDALQTQQKVRLYYETAADFAGIDPAAAWEDFKIGMGHFMRRERIAVVSDVEWIKHMIRIFSFLMPAATRVFSRAETPQARAWIVAADDNAPH